MANNDFSVLIKAILDDSSIGSADIDKIQRVVNKYNINLSTEIDTAKTVASVKKIVPELERELKKITGLDIKIDDTSILKAVKQVSVETAKATKEQDRLTESMARVREQSERLRLSEEKRQQTTQSNAINKNLEQEYNLRKKIETNLNGGLNSNYSTQINALQSQFEKLGLSEEVVKQKMQGVQSAYNTLASGGSNSTFIANNEKFTELLAIAQNEVKNLKTQWVSTDQVISSSQAKAKIADFNNYMTKNAALTKKAKAQLHGWIAELESGNVTKTGLSKINADFKTLDAQMRSSRKLGNTLFGGMAEQAKKFSQWVSVSAMVMGAFHKLKEGAAFIGEIDDALTDVAYTSDITNVQLKALGNSAVYMAKDLNTSASNILEAVKIYSTANATADDIMRKAKPAIMLSNVSGMSGAESSKTIQTSLNQFELEDTEQGLLDIVDTLEYVSSRLNYDFTDGIKEVTEGIEASGSVAKNAGLSMQEYAAMVGTAVEKTGQAGSTIGNAYKTIFSRITRASATEGTLDEDISKAEESLRSIGVEVRDSESEFRDLTDIMADLGSVWGSLSSVQKSNIGFNIAGTRQLNVVNSLLGSWESYEDIMGDIDDRAGMTMKNQEEYADSLKGHLGELTATGQSIANNLLNSDELKAGVDAGTGVLKFFESLSESLKGITSLGGNLNSLPATLTMIGSLVASIKGKGKPYCITPLFIHDWQNAVQLV